MAATRPWLTTVHPRSINSPSTADCGKLMLSTTRSAELERVTGIAAELPRLLSPKMNSKGPPLRTLR
ncbi:MAG: hypothetical protein AW07_04185 [Candidatus Accumulibacter sp. SK-11]|nr:MAG: hypothetical protein AW07_04185 [Candidatus Accumulibacter sp. SK-11]